MIPTFVITLREGVEASLIVGIIAAFLVKEGRQDALRQMWIGVGIAIVALHRRRRRSSTWSAKQLPQQQQEGLETIVGLIAVATITYMIVWMRRHARGDQGRTRRARRRRRWPRGSTMALVGMAFLAVLREGFETSVFLLAAFQDATDTTAAGAGAVLGLLAAVAIGRRPLPRRRPHQPHQVLPHHRPGPRLRRRRAAGDRRPHRPRGGLDQQPPGPGASTCAWLVQPGTISGSLLTGMLGPAAAARPRSRRSSTSLYAVPMALYVLWPDRLRRRRRSTRVAGGPSAPAENPA